MKKGFIIFFSTLIAITIAGAGGIYFLKATTKQNATGLLADSSAATPMPTTPVSLATTSTATSVSAIPVQTTPAAAPAPMPTPTATPAPMPTPTTPPTPAATTTPAQAPPTPTPAPAALSLPYSIGTFGNAFNDNDGWSQWWGSVANTNGELIIAAPGSSTGGGALLDGSGNWSNLTFTATLDWIQGETFGLVARYADDNDYVLCDFDERAAGDVYISLKQYQAGKETELAQGDVFNYNQLGGANLTAAIQVNGNQATCSFNNHTVSTALAEDALVNPPAQGEIGFTTWNPAEGASEIDIKNVGVISAIYDLRPNVEWQ